MAGSRLRKIQRKQSSQQALIYIVLSVALLVGLFKWGIPMLVNVVSLWSGGEEIVQEDGGGIRPQKPVLDPIPEATFSSSIKVSGYAQEGMRVKLRLNGLDNDEKEADGDGRFVFDGVELLVGDNEIEVKAINDKDEESEVAKVTVMVDREKPVLTIMSPDEEHQFYGQDQKTLEIVGEVDDAEDTVTINDNYVRVGGDGRFSFKTVMEDGANEYVIKVSDRAGNAIERVFRVFYSL